MDLRVPIEIVDELSDDLIKSSGLLDLSSGEIHQLKYRDYDLKTQGLPMESDDYEFTCGTLSSGGKDVEFRVEVDLFSGKYSVSANELLEIKLRAAKLFAGMSGQDLLAESTAKPATKPAAKAAAQPAAKKTVKGRPDSLH